MPRHTHTLIAQTLILYATKIINQKECDNTNKRANAGGSDVRMGSPLYSKLTGPCMPPFEAGWAGCLHQVHTPHLTHACRVIPAGIVFLSFSLLSFFFISFVLFTLPANLMLLTALQP